MEVKIHRGTHEIGGTCVEIKANNGKILWIDLGLPLEEKTPNVDYVSNNVDALLISHPHQDHYGLMDKINPIVPVYIGQMSFDLINASLIFRGLEQKQGNYNFIHAWQRFTILDTFNVSPFLVDHSSPEAFAFLIEVDGKRVFYSGDFRSTGRKGKVFDNLLENPLPNIDLLLVEGTMIGRNNHLYETELSIESAFTDIFKKQKNSSFVISSAQNIDRFISVFKACKKARKTVIIDVYTAWILDLVAKKSNSMPVIEWEGIEVYAHPSQMEKIKEPEFDEFRKRIIQQQAGMTFIKNTAKYVYFVRGLNQKLIETIKKHGTIPVIYSQWEGYLKEEHKSYSADYINKIRAEDWVDFQYIHTSGHATTDDLLRFAKAFNAKKIVPIHTSNPEDYVQEFVTHGITNVEIWEDGIEYELNE